MLVLGCQHHIWRMGKTMPAQYSVAVFEFPLEQCPPEDFWFPPGRDDRAGPWIEAGYHDGPYCHGFTKYASRDTTPIYARLEREGGCRVTIALPNDRSDTAPSIAPHAEQLAKRLLGPNAKGVLTMSSGSPSWQYKLTVLDNPAKFLDWCHARAGAKLKASSHKIFHAEGER
jgi:hypothetical protein